MATTVGILGGGQLARMMALAGARLGLRFKVVDTVADACASQVAPLTCADYNDFDAISRFADGIDVVTFDFENVPADTAMFIASRVPVFPNPQALAVAQDRLEEKQLFTRLGMTTPAFATVDSREDLESAVAKVGYPGILKTRRLGYDGKGQIRLRSADDLDAAWAKLGDAPLILESLVAFEREISVIGIRSRTGEFKTYALTQNFHQNSILSASLSPAPNTAAFGETAVGYARKLAEELDYVGVFALELFVHQGKLLANEMAPRVHNSGHWTIEGAETSQFEQHVRAICGWPLGSSKIRGEVEMRNLIGDQADRWRAIAAEPGAALHLYGKAEARPGRKMGHVTRVR